MHQFWIINIRVQEFYENISTSLKKVIYHLLVILIGGINLGGACANKCFDAHLMELVVLEPEQPNNHPEGASCTELWWCFPQGIQWSEVYQEADDNEHYGEFQTYASQCESINYKLWMHSLVSTVSAGCAIEVTAYDFYATNVFLLIAGKCHECSGMQYQYDRIAWMQTDIVPGNSASYTLPSPYIYSYSYACSAI